MNCHSVPPLTEANLHNQHGKVFIVTGSSGGLGKELVKILYQRQARVFIAARSEAKAFAAIDEIQREFPDSKGELEYLHLDLNDLTTIYASAQNFMSRSSRLDVLWNNAGVMTPPEGSKTAQGYELQLGTNVIATFLFTQYLRPILAYTAQTAPRDSVRVAWVASNAANMASKPVIDFGNMDYTRDESMWSKYCRSKAGVIVIAAEFGRRNRSDGILSVSIDPGVSMTDLQRDQRGPRRLASKILAGPPKNGAYTQLFAGLSALVTSEVSDHWVTPVGRLKPLREDYLDPELGRKYWDWLEAQFRLHLNGV